MMKRLLLIVCLTLTACGYRGGGSFVGSLPDIDATVAIARDAAALLASEYAPGHTALHVSLPEKNAQNEFSAAFEAALRERGFLISQESSGGAITVAFTLDTLKGEDGAGAAWYLHLRLSDGQTFARAYMPSGDPEAGRTSTTREKGSGANGANGSDREAL